MIIHELVVLQVSQEVLVYFSTIFFSLTKLCADLKWKKQKNNWGKGTFFSRCNFAMIFWKPIRFKLQFHDIADLDF